MPAKPQQNLFIKWATIVLVFLYLQFVLWSVLVLPAIDIYIQWVPKLFFSSAKQTTSILRIHHHMRMTLVESTLFSALALFGYFCGFVGTGGVGGDIYRTSLATFEESMMGIKYKYYWICLVPWIITFTQNWLQNVGKLLMLFYYTPVYEAPNIWSSVTMLMLFMCVQALLASEVICMAVYGWHAMKNFNEANMQWVQKKRFLDGDSLNTAFGVTC